MPSSYCFLLLVSCILPSATPEHNRNESRFDNYRIYNVEIGNCDHIELFQSLQEKSDCYSYYGNARYPGQQLTILVAGHKTAEITDLLDVYKVNHEIMTYNFQEKIDKQWNTVQPKHASGYALDWNHYFHLETIYDWLDKLAARYCYVTVIDMGLSTEGVPIKGVNISKCYAKTSVFIESGIHGREWIAPATATYIINELLTSTDPEVQGYANEFNWFIFPVVNPDGYKYSFEQDRMWRKSRRLFGACRGVDLNRNYPFQWNSIGSSQDPCRYDYAGPSAGSEKETQALIRFVESNSEAENIKTYISLHSFSQLIMFPYAFTSKRVSNYNDLNMIGLKAAEAIRRCSGRIYKTGCIYETIYPSSGGSKDWAHAVVKIPITFTFELRGAPNSSDLFILPAEEIQPTGRETLEAIKVMLREAKKLGYYD